MAGAWMFDEETMEFKLAEPYASKLAQAKEMATQAWMSTLMEWLSNECGYDALDLTNEFVRRVNKQEGPAIAMVESFVIEALEGNLI